MPRWIVWRLENAANGRPTKIPYGINGQKASTTDANTWSAYEDACAAAPRLGAAGLGFVFASDDDIIGIDLDHVIDEKGDIKLWARSVIDTLNSYTEFSPSETGFHILLRGKKPPGKCNLRFDAITREGFEIYENRRFFTVTGAHVDRTPVEIRTVPDDVLAELLREMEKKQPKKKSTNGVARAAAQSVTLDDAELLRRMFAARNGASIGRLYHGDFGHYPSASEADIALCAHLAFWTARDRAQMDRLFRASGLMRDKWDSPRGDSTIGALTIEKACANCREVYSTTASANGRVSPIVPTLRGESADVGASLEDEGGSPREWLDFETEQGVAELFVSRYRNDVRFVRTSESFYRWDGKRWKPDTDGATGRLIHSLARNLSHQALRTADEDLRLRRVKLALQYEMFRKQQAVLAIARDMLPIASTEEAFDSHKYLFNAQNGTIDLRTGELRAHRREDMLSMISPFAYKPGAKCERWNRFLSEVLITKDGQTDPQLVAYVQRAIGYSLTGDPRADAVFFLHGRGSNGKSTLLDVLADVIGDYACAANPDTFTKRTSDGPTYELARFYKKRFVTAIEVGSDKRLAEAMVKRLSGGDKIVADRKYKSAIEFVPECAFWFGVNALPRVDDTDEGIWSRIGIVPFNASFPRGTEACDESLSDALLVEGEGILAWAVDGCRSYLADGRLGRASAVTEATAGFRSDMDTFRAFLDDCCKLDPALRTSTAEIRKAYVLWAADNGSKPFSSHAITKQLDDRGLVRWKGAGKGRGFIGIGIVDPMTLFAENDTSEALSVKVSYAPAYREKSEIAKKCHFFEEVSYSPPPESRQSRIDGGLAAPNEHDTAVPANDTFEGPEDGESAVFYDTRWDSEPKSWDSESWDSEPNSLAPPADTIESRSPREHVVVTSVTLRAPDSPMGVTALAEIDYEPEPLPLNYVFRRVLAVEGLLVPRDASSDFLARTFGYCVDEMLSRAFRRSPPSAYQSRPRSWRVKTPRRSPREMPANNA